MDVTEWLRSLGLERYAATFQQNEISADLLPKLTAQDLQDLGVAAIGHRRRLLDAITTLRGAAGPPDQPGRSATAPTASAHGDQAAEAIAERRHITVLFCDLVGSTPLSIRLDPEDLQQVLEIYRRSVVAAVTGKGGYVARFIGDGVLAYFGWPNTDEAHAESAVRAALAAIESVRLHQLPVRIGIATGLVLVGGLIGSGAAQQHPAVGETPNLAARLQALAEPDTVVVSAATRSQLGRLFELEELGPVALRGFETPVTAWRARGETGPSSRSAAVYVDALAPLVGRGEELDLLLVRWHQAKGGEGQVVLLSGDAGIGKSRLLAALEERLAGESHASLRCFCSPHHQDSALYPITVQLEQEAGFSRDDTAKDRLAKLEAMLAPTAPTPEDVSSLAALVSISTDRRYPAPELSPQRRKELTFSALLHRLTRFAESGPVLILFEDAHWSDPTSLEFLDALIVRVPNIPVLLVISFRPDFSVPWVGRAGVSLTTLSQLDRGDATALAKQVVANHFLPSALINRIVLQADGVPLFIEELTKTVLASAAFVERRGAASPLTVPSTLQAALTARLDRLPSAKQVAQMGAVIGREFPHDLLMAISSFPKQFMEQGLEDLVASGLAVCRGPPKKATYAFRHALLRDVAYGMLLRGPKRELHARVAAVLEERFPDIVGQHPAVLAQHYTEAGMAERAIAYWIKAGRKSIAQSATNEAAAQFGHGFDLLPELPEGPLRWRMELELKSSRSVARWDRVTRGRRLTRPQSDDR